jgi:hypothetical protein
MADERDLSSVWRFRSGFITGLGFGLGLLAIILAWEWIDSYRKSPQSKEFSEKANVVVKNHRVTKDKCCLAVLGELENKGTGSWRYVNVRVEYFDDKGQFVHSCSDKLDGLLAPAQVRNFKVACYAEQNRPLPEFKTYKVVLDDAFAR